MATKAQLQKRKAIAQAKARRKEINYKYENYIPELLRSGNVRSILRTVEERFALMGVQRKKSSKVGTKQPCKTIYIN